MLRLFVALLLTCNSFCSVHAQTATPVIIDAEKASDLIVDINLNVILVQANASSSINHIEGQDFSGLIIKRTGSSLKISSNASFKGAVVYLLVQSLQSLTVGNNSQIQTDGILSAKQIDVYVNENAKAVIRTKGKVRAFGIAPYEANVKSSAIKISATGTSK